MKAVRCSNLIYVFGMTTIIGLSSYCGMLMYAIYHDCDPLTMKKIHARDQMFVLLVMELLGSIPGLVGVFLACLCGAAFSSFASGLNALSAIILEDFYKPCVKNKSSKMQGKIVLQVSSIIFGCVCIACTFIVEKLGGVLQLIISVDSITCGPMLGLIIIGLFLPWVSSKAASIGSLCSLAFMAWIVSGTQLALGNGLLKFPMKATSIMGCMANETIIDTTPTSFETINDIFVLYKLSYLWITTMGATVTIVMTLLVSLCTGWNDLSELDPDLISPFIRNKFMKNLQPKLNSDELDQLYEKKNMIIIPSLDIQNQTVPAANGQLLKDL